MNTPFAKAKSVVDLIGNTPLVELKNMNSGPCRLFVKLENQNPGGSIKDRIALSMIEAAEKEGRIRPGGTLVEATAGNTGLGLALVAALKGYRLILVIPDKMSREKVAHLKAMGAQVRMTRSDVGKGHPEYYQDVAERIARETPNAFYVNQFANPANPAAHENSTGPEIWDQLDHQVDAVICGVGSGGTLTGLSRFFGRVSPRTEIVLADPKGSILFDHIMTGKKIEPGSWLVEGIGEDFIPDVADLSRCKKAFLVSDQESFETARALLRQEGILAGSSSGTLIAAALRYCREQTSPKNVVTFVCDSGNKYLSKMFNDEWMTDQGMLSRPAFGDLRDLIARLYEERETVTIGPDETLASAFKKMRLHDVSQLPVLKDGQVVGILDESDMLAQVSPTGAGFTAPVRESMTSKIETITPAATVEQLQKLFAEGKVAIVEEKGRFFGLITRIDLLRHLRGKSLSMN